MRAILGVGVLAAALTGCSPGSAPSDAKPAAPAQAKPVVTAPAPASNPALQAINAAAFTPPAPNATPASSAPPAGSAQTTTPAATPPDPVIIREEVILDRARFSPGVIDGKPGTNQRHALAAFQTAQGLPATGDLDAATWQALTKDGAPVAANYTITAADVAGPFAPDVGEDFVKLAALPNGPLFSTPLEALATQFHMSQALLTALNPGADFTKAGTVLVVAAPGGAPFAKGDVKRIEVSKAHAQLTAYGDNDAILAVYPATVGSTERPSPSGTHKINGVAWNTDYEYDPSKLHWGPRSHGKLHIKPGPKNPVGVVWIDLNAPSYGIHGTPDPTKIGKTASHGCVRLTNWDALALAHGVKPGVIVTFVGARA
jgi:lipoprotein-anchoring transpeptidase ErfK/SrfK